MIFTCAVLFMAHYAGAVTPESCAMEDGNDGDSSMLQMVDSDRLVAHEQSDGTEQNAMKTANVPDIMWVRVMSITQSCDMQCQVLGGTCNAESMARDWDGANFVVPTPGTGRIDFNPWHCKDPPPPDFNTMLPTVTVAENGRDWVCNSVRHVKAGQPFNNKVNCGMRSFWRVCPCKWDQDFATLTFPNGTHKFPGLIGNEGSLPEPEPETGVTYTGQGCTNVADRVTELAECETAALQLEPDHPSVRIVERANLPPGCIMKTRQENVVFNNHTGDDQKPNWKHVCRL